MTWIQDLFGKSPIRPMQQHMQAAMACAREVKPLFAAMAAGDLEAIASRRAEIDRLEHEADRIKNEIRGHLPRRLLMAVERRDMLEILDLQDSIADTAQDIAELADLRGMHTPESLRPLLAELVDRVVRACEQSQRVIDELDELVETGFSGREVGRVEEMIDELSRIESDTDDLEERLRRAIFAQEESLGVGTWFWCQIVGWVADLADYAEKVGNRLRLLIAS
jgi:predicted phosphate transport protein (TIGR00153 family)